MNSFTNTERRTTQAGHDVVVVVETFNGVERNLASCSLAYARWLATLPANHLDSVQRLLVMGSCA